MNSQLDNVVSDLTGKTGLAILRGSWPVHATRKTQRSNVTVVFERANRRLPVAGTVAGVRSIGSPWLRFWLTMIS